MSAPVSAPMGGIDGRRLRAPAGVMSGFAGPGGFDPTAGAIYHQHTKEGQL